MEAKALNIRKADKKDLSLIEDMIKHLAAYEKKPQDMTATKELLNYWLFERKIACVLIAEYNSDAIGYAVYYPVFGTFSAIGKIYLEDLFIKEEFRHRGFGRYFLAKIAELSLSEGYSAMEWSCLSHNKPSIEFYKKLGVVKESGVEHFKLDKIGLKAVSAIAKQPF